MVDDKKSYYCNNLCGVKEHCKFYEEYLNKLKLEQEGYKKDLDILSELDLL